ncbi:hypothetical protein [Microbacterium aurantiacum]|uniref:hypothetical protein n=1 Tax=Microbacterium aurantiacum TaxID=162393 RepID=UPI000C80DA83|nr:hypothetical protein [Microbacterium aurantiacum]
MSAAGESVQGAAFGEGPRWLIWTVVGAAGLLYSYAVWNAVAYLVSILPSGLTVIGWVTLLFGVLFPIIVFALALAIGRRRNVGDLALVLLAGLGVVAVFWLNLLGYSVLNMDELVTVSR